MSPCKDDDILYPDQIFPPRESRLARTPGTTRTPGEGTFRSFLEGPDVDAFAQPAIRTLLRKPSVLGQVFRAVGRAEAVKDAAAAAEVMRYTRLFISEYTGAQHDVALHIQAVMGIARQIDQAHRLHDGSVELAARGLEEAISAADATRNRRGALQAKSAALLDGGSPGVVGQAASVGQEDPWSAQDDLSRRARVAVIQGAAAIESEKIDDPAVAFAAVTYLRKLQTGADDETARRATFNDVRDLLAARGFAPKDAEVYTQTLKQVRAEYKKGRDAKAGLGFMAAAIRGGKV